MPFFTPKDQIPTLVSELCNISMLDMNANTKIPDDLVHKLPFRWFRTWFQCLEQLWFNFKICGIFTQLLVVFRQPFWYGASIVKELQLKVPAEPAENYRSENRNCRNKYTLSTDRQSSQLKYCKFYENFSEYANFSKSSHKGHKTKGQILIHSLGSLWTKV